MEKSFRSATRIALNSPFDVRNNRYIPYEKRSEILSFPGLDLRLKAQAANLGITILNGDIESSFRNTIENYLNTEPRPGLRYVRLFQYNRYLPSTSPIELIIQSMTHFQGVIKLDESPATNKLNIKKKIEQELRT